MEHDPLLLKKLLDSAQQGDAARAALIPNVAPAALTISDARITSAPVVNGTRIRVVGHENLVAGLGHTPQELAQIQRIAAETAEENAKR